MIDPNGHVTQGQWRQLRGRAKERWGRLTDDDLDRAEGRLERLAGTLQERYGMAREEARQKLAELRSKL